MKLKWFPGTNVARYSPPRGSHPYPSDISDVTDVGLRERFRGEKRLQILFWIMSYMWILIISLPIASDHGFNAEGRRLEIINLRRSRKITRWRGMTMLLTKMYFFLQSAHPGLQVSRSVLQSSAPDAERESLLAVSLFANLLENILPGG